jgi:hypothetical protein
VYLLSAAERIACKDASLFGAFSYPRAPLSTFYKLLCATRWLKGGKNFRASREAKWPRNSISMRVQTPPLRCRGDSLSPNLATGPQEVAAGINGKTLGALPGPLA